MGGTHDGDDCPPADAPDLDVDAMFCLCILLYGDWDLDECGWRTSVRRLDSYRRTRKPVDLLALECACLSTGVRYKVSCALCTRPLLRERQDGPRVAVDEEATCAPLNPGRPGIPACRPASGEGIGFGLAGGSAGIRSHPRNRNETRQSARASRPGSHCTRAFRRVRHHHIRLRTAPIESCDRQGMLW